MPTRLNQIIAVEATVKGQTHSAVTAAHHQLQRLPQMNGITRTYQPLDEENGERFPDERTKVQVKATDVIGEVVTALTRLFDVTATKDWANTQATANVELPDGTTLLKDVPVTYLLFLEKQLTDLHTFIRKLPVLDPAEEWEYDATSDAWRTPVVRTVKGKKVPRAFEASPATDRHPAQVQVWQEDVTIGHWNTTRFSGALPAGRIQELLERVTDLQAAVKFAREAANTTDVTERKVGKQVLDYLFG